MSELDDLIESAQRLEATDRFREAIDVWRRVVAIDGRPDIITRLGRCLFLEGDYPEDESLWRETIVRSPGHADAYFFLGYLYKKTARLEEAIPVLQTALRLKEWGRGYTTLGAVQRRLGQNAEARANFKRAIGLDSQDAEAWNLLGTLTEDPREAADAFSRAIAADPTDVNAYRGLGEVYWKQHDLTEAERWFRKAIDVNDDDAWSHNFLGQMLMERGSLVEAEAELRRAVNLMSDAVLFHTTLGEVLERLERIDEAESAYKAALAVDVSNYLANLRYGRLLRYRGHPAKALVYARRALAAAPADRRALELIQSLE